MIDSLNDAFRWWSAPGAMLALAVLWDWWRNGFPKLDQRTREISAVTMFFTMLAILFAGSVIPWATDGRIEGFTQDSLLYRSMMLGAWGCWAVSAWSIPIAFAQGANKLKMVGGSLSWLAVAFIAAEGTVGALL